MLLAAVVVSANDGAPVLFVFDDAPTPDAPRTVRQLAPKNRAAAPDFVNVTVCDPVEPTVAVHTLTQAFDATLTTCCCVHVNDGDDEIATVASASSVTE